jgi:ADP-ribosylglycohydrolase
MQAPSSSASLPAGGWPTLGDGMDGTVPRAVNPGHDADTTDAVCGQLAEAGWGESGIPAEPLAGLAGR